MYFAPSALIGSLIDSVLRLVDKFIDTYQSSDGRVVTHGLENGRYEPNTAHDYFCSSRRGQHN